jgi:hypothetical protein
MDVTEYFARTDTPAEDSLVGKLILRLLDKRPGISFGEARAEAHQLLNKAARTKTYKVAAVLSIAELAVEKDRLSRAFARAAV